MDERMSRLTARAIMDALRKNELELEEMAGAATWPLWDHLRAAVVSEDKDLALRLLTASDAESVAVGFVLIRCFKDDEDVRRRILDIWSNADDDDFTRRIGCVFHLSEYEGIAEDLQGEFLKFLEDHRNQFEVHLRRWYEDEQLLLDAFRDRVDNAKSMCPANRYKQWLYVYQLSFTQECWSEAVGLVRRFSAAGDEFAERVADSTIDHLTKGRAAMMKLKPQSEDDYGDLYKAHCLEIYKMFVEMADRISTRRQSANSFFLSINTVVIGAVGYVGFGAKTVDPEFYVMVAGAGVCLCFFWFCLIVSYRNLNSAKFKVVHEIEQVLPLAPYDAEWEAAGQGRRPLVYMPLTYIEMLVPWVFLLLHAFVFIAGRW